MLRDGDSQASQAEAGGLHTEQGNWASQQARIAYGKRSDAQVSYMLAP